MLRPHQHGVTLIELMVTLSILGLLILAAIPSYSRWIQNAQIRTASDAILNGLQLARAEAVRRNALVQFSLASGTGWTITSASTVVQSRAAGEGTRSVILTNVVPANANTVTFNGLGRISPNVDASLSIASLDLDVASNVLSAADSRDLRIAITAGQISLCDPTVSDIGDYRRC